MGNTPSIVASKVQTSRQPAQRPQNSRPIFEVLSETVDTIGAHASSLTVTPLPKGLDIVVRTSGTAKTYSGQTAAFLSGKRRLRTEEGVEDAKGLTHRGQVKCTITGIEPTNALARAIRSHVGEKDVHMESVDGNSIKLRARMDYWEFHEKVGRVCGTINDLRSMGLDDDSVVEMLHVYDRDKRLYPDETIIQFVRLGHHRLAKHCLGSGGTAVDGALIDILRQQLTDRDVDLSALPLPRGRDETRRELIALFCLDLCTRENPDPLQAACLVRDYLNYEEGPLPYQEMVMSCLLGAMRSPDDASRLMKRLLPVRSQATNQWLKRLAAKQWLTVMASGPFKCSSAQDRAVDIKRILAQEHCALAYDLICDLATALDQHPDLKKDPKLAKLCALRDLDKFNIKLHAKGEDSDSAYFKAQKGKMMLRNCWCPPRKEADWRTITSSISSISVRA